MEIIFDPAFAEIFEKYNLKQSGNGQNSKSHPKNFDDPNGEEGASAQKSRETDEIGSPFSALSAQTLPEEFIPIHDHGNPLCLTDRFNDQVIVGETPEDANDEFTN